MILDKTAAFYTEKCVTPFLFHKFEVSQGAGNNLHETQLSSHVQLLSSKACIIITQEYSQCAKVKIEYAFVLSMDRGL